MLTAYRRHKKSCHHKNEGRHYRRCQCPIWVDGFLGDREFRKTTKLRDWDKAQALVRQWESEGECSESSKPSPLTIEEAKQQFLADALARNLKDKTIYKYRLLFKQLTAFAQKKGICYLKELDPSGVRAFRVTWKDGSLASVKKLERLRSFSRFAHENGWIEKDFTSGIKNPRVSVRPTLPFSNDEVIKTLTVCADKIANCSVEARSNAILLRLLVLVLRYSGLRIGDAVGCSVERLRDGKLRLYTQKTGTHVHCPLPEFVLKELASAPRKSERYWFWSGKGKLQTAVTDWQGRLADLFEIVGISKGHAHRMRDTFAVELLMAGVPLERVSILLGHTSIRVTERHYSPWIRERQEQAEADVKRTWAQDPVALLETKGTQEVHENRSSVN